MATVYPYNANDYQVNALKGKNAEQLKSLKTQLETQFSSGGIANQDDYVTARDALDTALAKAEKAANKSVGKTIAKIATPVAIVALAAPMLIGSTNISNAIRGMGQDTREGILEAAQLSADNDNAIVWGTEEIVDEDGYVIQVAREGLAQIFRDIEQGIGEIADNTRRIPMTREQINAGINAGIIIAQQTMRFQPDDNWNPQNTRNAVLAEFSGDEVAYVGLSEDLIHNLTLAHLATTYAQFFAPEIDLAAELGGIRRAIGSNRSAIANIGNQVAGAIYTAGNNNVAAIDRLHALISEFPDYSDQLQALVAGQQTQNHHLNQANLTAIANNRALVAALENIGFDITIEADAGTGTGQPDVNINWPNFDANWPTFPVIPPFPPQDNIVPPHIPWNPNDPWQNRPDNTTPDLATQLTQDLPITGSTRSALFVSNSVAEHNRIRDLFDRSHTMSVSGNQVRFYDVNGLFLGTAQAAQIRGQEVESGQPNTPNFQDRIDQWRVQGFSEEEIAEFINNLEDENENTD
ncbi:MAG: hypothetical protein FWE01_02770 [Firmicutes bacterium]|nr:hypothetical protein [Bacillota bacterium]